MTYENCIKYMNEAKDEETKLFWKERAERKTKPVEVVKEVVEEKTTKKGSKK